MFDILNVIFFVLVTLTFLYPFWYTFLLSFSGIDDVKTLGFHFWISEWHTTAYSYILNDPLTPLAYANSIFRTGVGTVLTIVATIMAAYTLSKKRLPGRNLITLYFLISMFFGGGLIPTYLLIRNIGLIDSRWVLVVPMIVSGFNIIIVRNFLMTIDVALEESAFIDGAHYLQILFRIIFPLSKPVLATIALWTAVAHWNAWFDCLIYIQSESKMVLQILLRRILMQEQVALDAIYKFGGFMEDGEHRLPPEAVKAATTLVTIGPIILVYPFLQRYFVKGILVGSLKG